MRIKHININGSQIPLTSLNIIVGPNGVGKTTLLRDLHSEFIGRSGNESSAKWTNLLEESSFDASLNDWKEWRDSLHIVTGESYNNTGRYYADLKSMGRQNKPQRVKDVMLTRIDQAISDSQDGRLDFFIQSNNSYDINVLRDIVTPFKDQRSVLMTVDDRFYLSDNNTGYYNIDAGGGIQPAPFLADNDDILRSINSKIISLFGKKIFAESRILPEISLFVGRSDIGQPKKFTNSPKNLRKTAEAFDKWIKNNSIVNLKEEGHGIRAAIQILYELENKSNKIVFIDEPEIHLYPSAKYVLGRYIGDYARQGKKQVVVTTHDTDMLRGLVDADSKATVIRINRDRSVRSVKDSKIQKAIPSSVLQSAFLDAVIVTEGVSDKYVYEGVLHHNNLLQNTSYQVIGMSGKETVAHSFYFFNLLGIKCSAVYDFDFLWHKKRSVNTIERCIREKKISESIKDNLLNKSNEINDFMQSMDGKKRGINCPELSDLQKQKIINCLSDFAKEGIFISPIGELEDWVNVNKSMGKNGASPEIILRKYKSRSRSTYKGLTDFVTDIAKYIEGTEQ